MAKKKRKKGGPPSPKKVSQKPPFFSRHPVWLTVILLLILLLIFYHEVVFEGKTLLAPDALNSLSYGPFIKDALKRGIYPLWLPYIFSGMPSFASLASAPYVNIFDALINGILGAIRKVVPLTEFAHILVNYLLFGCLVYLLLRTRKASVEACLFAAIAVIFMPQFIAFNAFGHGTKLLSTVLIPLIFLLVDRLLEKRNPLLFALAALAIGFQLLRAHVQVSYYTFLAIGLYFIFYSIWDFKEKRSFGRILGSGGLLAGAIALGMVLSSVLYVSIYEYSHYSIRGGGTSGGLSYQYASSWSFSPVEMVTFLVPSFMGFGGSTYWGPMPFTDYPLYIGLLPLLLVGVALIFRRDKYVIFFSVLALFSLVVSFGNHLPILYKPMFNFLPFFNKFRVPSMIHILLDISVVIIAGLGLNAILNLKESVGQKIDSKKIQALTRYLYIFGGICAVIAIFLLIGKGAYLDWVAGSGKNLGAQEQNLAYQKAARDGIKMLIILGVGISAILTYLKGKLSRGVLGITLIGLLIVDLWWVDFKIITPQPETDTQEFFAPNEAVRFLQSDSEPFRIYPVVDTKPANWYMYHRIQNINGYHAAKLRIYQEFLEETGLDPGARNRYGFPPFLSKYLSVVFKDGRPSLQINPLESIPQSQIRQDNNWLDLLNVKYLLSFYPIPDPRYQLVQTGQPDLGVPSVYQNTGALPRAFFVNQVKVLEDKESIFDFMRSEDFNPAEIAVIEEQPPFPIESADSNHVDLTFYDIHEIHLKTEVVKPALLVLSEIYYPAGWKAYVNGEEQKIYKTDYILRSIFLKPGSHEIKFIFNPASFKIGLWLSLITLLVLLAIIVVEIKFKHQKINP